MKKEPVEVPRDERGMPIYTPEQIEAYEAVMDYEARRCGDDPSDERTAEHVRMMSGGVHGKSALLERIASGQTPFVLAPPRAMSYPWYDVVEGDGPFEVMNEGETVQDLIKVGAHSGTFLEIIGPHVIIEQSFWNVVRVVDDTHVEVSQLGWLERGFVWQLSLDETLVADTKKNICSWHDPSLGRITTAAQLLAEQRWHVEKGISMMMDAQDDDLFEMALVEARAKDASANQRVNDTRAATGDSGITLVSKFNELSTRYALEAKRKHIAERVAAGKSAIPDDVEIAQMVQEKVEGYYRKENRNGFGWYSADASGNLWLHHWRLHRISPTTPGPSIYLDVSSIPRAAKASS